eukprot:1194556-Prorocentrum_minimum.AAC.3
MVAAGGLASAVPALFLMGVPRSAPALIAFSLSTAFLGCLYGAPHVTPPQPNIPNYYRNNNITSSVRPTTVTVIPRGPGVPRGCPIFMVCAPEHLSYTSRHERCDLSHVAS